MAIRTLSTAIRNNCVELLPNQVLKLASQEILLLPAGQFLAQWIENVQAFHIGHPEVYEVFQQQKTKAFQIKEKQRCFSKYHVTLDRELFGQRIGPYVVDMLKSLGLHKQNENSTIINDEIGAEYEEIKEIEESLELNDKHDCLKCKESNDFLYAAILKDGVEVERTDEIQIPIDERKDFGGGGDIQEITKETTSLDEIEKDYYAYKFDDINETDSFSNEMDTFSAREMFTIEIFVGTEENELEYKDNIKESELSLKGDLFPNIDKAFDKECVSGIFGDFFGNHVDTFSTEITDDVTDENIELSDIKYEDFEDVHHESKTFEETDVDSDNEFLHEDLNSSMESEIDSCPSNLSSEYTDSNLHERIGHLQAYDFDEISSNIEPYEGECISLDVHLDFDDKESNFSISLFEENDLQLNFSDIKFRPLCLENFQKNIRKKLSQVFESKSVKPIEIDEVSIKVPQIEEESPAIRVFDETNGFTLDRKIMNQTYWGSMIARTLEVYYQVEKLDNPPYEPICSKY
ncbi:hypothetical protein WDU94_002128 [Cyamophila willieti]